MKAKLALLASSAAFVLTLLCYVWVMNMAVLLGEKILEYLDAVASLAQLT